MSGVIIDVETNSEKAKSDLRSLNRSLADMVLSGNKAGRSLSTVDNGQFKQLDKSVQRSTESMKSFGRSGSSSLRAVASDTAALRANIDILKGSVLAVAGVFAATQGARLFTRAGDDLLEMQNRLKLVTEGTRELATRQRQLFSTARDTRTSFAANVQIFTTFSKALEKANVSGDRVVKINKTIQQAGTLSGASVEGLNAALIQLGQGIGSGVLRGEEFNSVMEQMMYLGNGLAKSLGVSISQLRKMANDGELTTEKLVGALEKMASTTERDFQKTAVSTSKGIASLRQSLAYFFGDLNQTVGVSQTMGSAFQKMSERVSFGADGMVIRLTTVRRAFKNYFDQLRTVAGSGFDLKKAFYLSDDDRVNETQRALKERSASMVKRIQELMRGQRDADSQAGNLVSKLFGRIKRPSKEDGGFFDMGDTRRTVRAIVDTSAQIAKAVETTGWMIKRIVPTVRTPMIRFREEILSSFAVTNKEMETSVYKKMLPLIRKVEVARDALTVGINDDAAPRAFVELFKSADIEQFAERLSRLNDLMDNHFIRWNSMGYFLGEKRRALVYSWLFPTQDLLVKLGLMQNRLFMIRDTKLDRTVAYFKLIGDMIARAYNDLVAPDLNLFAYKVKIGILVVAKTALDMLKDTFNFANGKALGAGLVKGVGAALGAVVSVAKRLVSFDFGSDAESKKLAARLRDSLMGAMASIPGFFGGLVTGIGRQLADAFESIDFSALLDGLRGTLTAAVGWVKKMFDDILGYTDKPLASVERRVRAFGDRVKGVFYDAWDAVVGHSYWPDLVDDVNDYTKHLFKSNKLVDQFKEIILRSFRSLYESVSKMGGKAADTLSQVSLTIRKVDWGQSAKNIAGQLGTVLYAAFTILRSSSGPLRLISAAYLLSIMDTATGGLLRNLAPTIGDVGGAMGAQLAVMMGKGLFEGFVLIGHALPKFLESMFVNLGQATFGFDLFGNIFRALDNFVPVFSNNMIGAIAAITVAWLKFTGQLKVDKLKGLMEIFTGTKKKDGSVKEHGVGAAFFEGYAGPLVGNAAKFLPSGQIAKKLIDQPAFALAAAGILSAGLTDAFKMTDAFSAAVPFMAIAVMGKGGGARLLKDIASGLFKVVRGASAIVAREVATTVLPRETGAAFLRFMDNFDLSKYRPRVAPGAQAGMFSDVSRNFKQMLVNLEMNRKRYAEGAIDLSETLFKSSPVGPNGPVQPVDTSFKRSFDDLLNQMGYTEGAVARTRDRIRTGMDNFYLGLQAAATNANVGLRAAFSRLSEMMLSILRNKALLVALAAAIAVGMAGTANAATGTADAFSQLGDRLAPVAIAAAALYATFKGIKLLAGASRIDMKVKRDYYSENVGPEVDRYRDVLRGKARDRIDEYDSMSRSERKANGYTTRSALSDSLDEDIARKAAAREKELKGYYKKDADAAGGSAMKAYLLAPFQSLKDALTQKPSVDTGALKENASYLKGFASALRAATIATLFNTKAQAAQAAQGTRRATQGAFRDLVPANRRLADNSFKPAGLLTYRLDDAEKKGASAAASMLSGAGLAGGLKKMGGALAKGAGGIVGFVPKLLGFLGPWGKLAAVALTLGGVLYGAIGPMEGFMDNLKLAAANLAALFGIEIKTKAKELNSLVTDFGKSEVDGDKFDITEQLRNIDGNKLSDAQIEGLRNALAASNDTFKMLNDASVAQGGKLTAAQEAEKQRTRSEVEGLLVRYPQRETASSKDFGQQMAIMQRRRVQGDNSFSGNFSRLLGGDTSNVVASGNGAFSLFYDVRDNLSDFSTGLQGAVAALGAWVTGVATFDVAKWLVQKGRENSETFTAVDDFLNGIGPAIRERIRDKDNAPAQMYNEFEKGFMGDTTKYFKDLQRAQPDVANKVISARDQYDKAARQAESTRKVVQAGGYDRSMGDRDPEDAQRRYQRELAFLARIEQSYRRIGIAAGKIGKFENQKEALRVGLKNFANRTKDLGVDFGKEGEKFFGTDRNMASFDAYAQQRDRGQKALSRVTDNAGRLRASNMVYSAEQGAAGLKEQMDARRLFSGAVKQGSEANGVSSATLAALAVSGSAAGKALKQASESYLELKTRLDTAPSDATPAQLRKLQEDADRAEAKMRSLATSFTGFEGLNQALSGQGLQGLDLNQYVKLPDQKILGLNKLLMEDIPRASDAAARALAKVGKDGSGLDEYKAALQGVLRLQRQAETVRATGIRDAVAAVSIGGPAGTAVAADVAGVQLNSRQLRNKGTQGAVGKLTTANASVAGFRELMATRPLSADEATKYGNAVRDAADAQEALDKLGEKPEKVKKDKYGFKELLADVNEAGVAIDALGFSRLEATSRKSLSSIASQIHGIEKQLEKATPTQDVSGLLVRKAKLLADMRQKLVDAFDKTGKAIGESLSRSGLSDKAQLAQLSAGQVKQIVEYDKLITLRQADLDDATGPEEYAQALRKVLNLEQERAAYLDRATSSPDKWAERINAIFSSSLDTTSADLIGSGLAEYLSSAADAVKAKLEEMRSKGLVSFEWMRDIKRQGEYISLFSDVATSMEDSMVRGSRAAFKKIKDLVPDYGVSERKFRRFSPDQRREALSNAVNLDALDRAQSLPNLTKPLADILNSFDGSNQADVMERFREEWVKEFKTKFEATPLESSMDRLTTAVDGLNTTLTGKSVMPATLSATPAGVAATPDDFGKLVDITLNTESGGRRYGKGGKLLRSSKGAQGEMQVMPGTARDPGFGVRAARDGSADELARVGKDYLSALLKIYGSVDKMWAAYNAGPGNLNKAMRRGGEDWLKRLPKETQDYVAKNMAAYKPSVARSPEAEGQDIVVTANPLVDYGRGEVNADTADKIDRARKRFTGANGGGLKDKLATAGMDLKTLDLFDPKQLAKLGAYQERIDDLNEAIAAADATGQDTSVLARELQNVQGNMDRFTDRVVHMGDSLRQAGEQLAQSLDRNLNDALFNAFTGKGGFFKSIFNGLSQDILRQATGAITAPITGENGVVTQGIRSIFGGNKDGKLDLGGVGGFFGGLFGKKKKKEGPLGSFMSGWDFNPISDSPESGGIGGNLLSAGTSGIGKIFGKGAGLLDTGITDAGTGIADLFGSTGGDVAGLLGDSLTSAGTDVAKSIGGSLSGMSAGGVVGAAAGLGSLFGTLIGGFFAEGGAVSTNGKISGPGTGTSDSILAMVSDDEHIIKARQARKYRPLLNAINNDTLPKFATGGVVGASESSMLALPTVGTIDESKLPSRQESGKTEINLGITGDINRQTKATIYEMLPQIAAGVRQHNKEQGYR